MNECSFVGAFDSLFNVRMWRVLNVLLWRRPVVSLTTSLCFRPQRRRGRLGEGEPAAETVHVSFRLRQLADRPVEEEIAQKPTWEGRTGADVLNKALYMQLQFKMETWISLLLKYILWRTSVCLLTVMLWISEVCPEGGARRKVMGSSQAGRQAHRYTHDSNHLLWIPFMHRNNSHQKNLDIAKHFHAPGLAIKARNQQT